MSDFNSQSESAEPPPNEHSGSEAALDLPVDRRVIEPLFRAGMIDDRGRQESLRLISGPVVWWPWIDKALLFLGLALALTGVVCFFAWNWPTCQDSPSLASWPAAEWFCGRAWNPRSGKQLRSVPRFWWKFFWPSSVRFIRRELTAGFCSPPGRASFFPRR
jgi:hypothetical protein